jgi:D-glycero-D-manno-heptose 1,7-bisphosphate phosphatase
VKQQLAKRAVILDRDGTIVVDRGYLDDPRGLLFLPGAAEGLRKLHERGHRIIVVTNQSGVGRGRLRLERMHEVNDRFAQMVEEIGARIDGIYCCIHRPEDDCDCRKPRTGLVLEAAAILGFDPAHAVVIGDKSSDVGLGQRLNAVTMLVSQNGAASDGIAAEPDYVIRDLIQAARIIEDLETGGNPVGSEDGAGAAATLNRRD